jgi:hypothetical protein
MWIWLPPSDDFYGVGTQLRPQIMMGDPVPKDPWNYGLSTQGEYQWEIIQITTRMVSIFGGIEKS